LKKFEDLSKNNGASSLFEVGEAVGIPQNRTLFFPGRFYSLKIESPVIDLNEYIVPELNYGREYYDLNPVGLSLFHDNWTQVAIILNLKVLPPQVCGTFLEAYYYFAAQNGLPNLFSDGELSPLEERRLIDQRFYFVTPSILSQIIGATNLNYAINKYNIESIMSAKLIDWDNFGQLVNPRLDRRGMFPENLNLASVYANFMTNSIA
jgi:hypothetical protein